MLIGVLSLLDCDFASSCDVIKDGAHKGLFLTMYEVTVRCEVVGSLILTSV